MPDETSASTFTQIYDDHARLVLAYALRRVDTPADAADVVAETFLVVWRRLEDRPSAARTRSWIFGIARRVLANLHRGNRRRRTLARQLRTRLAQEALTADPADGVAAGLTEQQALRAGFAALAPGDREVLELTAWEGLSPTEIAEVLEIPAATVRTRLHRARARLQQLLEVERNGGAGHVGGSRQDPAAMETPR